MPTFSSYIKTTEANILSNPPTADGAMAFSTDTKKLFISEGTEWRFWQADKTLGKYNLGADQVARPLHHIDPTVSESMQNSSGLSVGNGDGVAKIQDLAGGEFIESPTSLEQPTLVNAAGTTPYALPEGDARINGLPVWQFNGYQYLEPSIEMKRQRIHANAVTIMFVARQPPQIKNADGTQDSVYYQDDYSYTAILGIYDNISLTPRNDHDLAKRWYNNYLVNDNFTYLNRYEGDLGECSLVAFRMSNNPNVKFMNGEFRHITSLGSQLNSSRGEIDRFSSGSSSSIGFGGLRLGTNRTHASHKMRGEIGEVIVWAESLSESDYNKAGSYLANKWGFTW